MFSQITERRNAKFRERDTKSSAKTLLTTAAIVSCLFVGACSREQGAEMYPEAGMIEPHIQGWFSPSYRVKVPATVIEFVADRGVRDWVIDIGIDKLGVPENLAPAPWPIQLPEPLSDLVRVRTAKMFVNQQGRREFRMLFEHPESSERAMHDIMSKTTLPRGTDWSTPASGRKGLAAPSNTPAAPLSGFWSVPRQSTR